MHRLALDILGQADLGGIDTGTRGYAGDRAVLVDAAVLREKLQREQSPPSGNDGMFAALVLADDERLQKPVCGDRGGKLFDAVLCAGPADIAVPGGELVEGYVRDVGHLVSPLLRVSRRGETSRADKRPCHRTAREGNGSPVDRAARPASDASE
jgi:hypothetical protein